MACLPQHHLQRKGRAVAAADSARPAVYALSPPTDAAINMVLSWVALARFNGKTRSQVHHDAEDRTDFR
jgi:hypothetical protein